LLTSWEWIVTLVIAVVVILWGPSKIPELARALGRAKGEFDKAQKEFESAAKLSSETTAPHTSDDALIETAKKLGITTEGKTKEQISQEIVERVKATDSA